jgi:hydrogenase expression/formation protein HypD
MVRVPGVKGSLAEAKAAGGAVRILYSPMEALSWAKAEQEKTFVLTAVGFETTLPLYALLINRALEEGIKNLKLLLSVKALLPALGWICMNNPDIDGFLGPGHVSTILGWGAYETLCKTYKIPLTVGGFGYEQIVAAVYDLVEQVKSGAHEVHNLYPNAVSREGNLAALSLIEQYFVKKPSPWRGLGEIGASGYFLAPDYETFDAGSEIGDSEQSENIGCLCGSVIIGRTTPRDCRFFGKGCSPAHPLGPCMVSAEGTCGIWHKNGAK